MKRIISFVLVGILLFALLFELNKSDPEMNFSFRQYVEYVTTNIRQFPSLEWKFSLDPQSGDSGVLQFFQFILDFLSYPFQLIGVFIYNVGVIFNGFFPISDLNFGSFGGGGHGGGGFGVR